MTYGYCHLDYYQDGESGCRLVGTRQPAMLRLESRITSPEGEKGDDAEAEHGHETDDLGGPMAKINEKGGHSGKAFLMREFGPSWTE